MNVSVADLAATLAASSEENYVRIVADWLTRGQVDSTEPRFTGTRVVDALVGAATAHLARMRGVDPPDWTLSPDRALPGFWHASGPRFFAYSLAHTPAEFAIRGVIVERDSLVSV